MKSSNLNEHRLIQVYSYNEAPFGLTLGQWTVEWWKWLLSCPIQANPAYDGTGINSSLNQRGPIWFLAGTFGEHEVPHRASSIPSGKGILFPIINYELNLLENPEFVTDDALIRAVKKDEDDIKNILVIVDGQSLSPLRVQTDPKLFFIHLPPDNCLHLPPKRIKFASDGYWIFLKPLRIGQHRIFFHASCSGGVRKCTVSYDITVF